MKKITLALLALISLPVFAEDLAQIYQLAAENNGTYLAAVQTYKAASYGVPIARANLLPSAALSANTTGNRQSPGTPRDYNSNGYTLTLTQPLLNVGAWYTLAQANATYGQAAITLGQALQTLIQTTASDYFGVLEAEDQLRYAQANQASLKEQLTQTEAQYKVGLKALTDVQSTRASYESAVASTLAAENSLSNAKETLAAFIGKPTPPLAKLKQDFPLLKPNPADSNQWVQYGLQNNLALQSADFQTQIDQLGVKSTATTGYLPTVNAVGSYANTKSNNANPAPNYRTKTSSIGAQLSWDLFNGGSTYASVKQGQYTVQADQANAEQTRRETESNIQQAYLNVLSNISQIQAYQQAVVSGQASLKAMKAGYLVGTRTIVDVLTQQSNLFQSEQQYAQALYNYLNDSLTLKQQAGTLAPQDIAAINDWLNPESLTSASQNAPTETNS